MQVWKERAVQIFCLFIFFYTMGDSSVLARKSASIVICAETGAVHHQINADLITHPASLTKMMTLYLTFKALREKRLSLDQKLLVSRAASQQEPSKLGLKPGTTITVRQAILALVIKSANDAAVVLAETLGRGSEAHFAQLMTHQARNLGMTKTVFKNASGLPHKDQITTARDMATLSMALYKHFPRHFKFFKEQAFVYKGKTHSNHNHLLGKVKGVDGIKTGFINASGFNLAASMVRNNRRIIAVVMGGETAKARDKKMVQLLEATHSTLNEKKAPKQSGNYASIGDLIHALGPSEAHADILPIKKTNIRKATYLSRSGKVKLLKGDFNSLGDLLKAIDEKPITKKNYIKNTKTKRTSKLIRK